MDMPEVKKEVSEEQIVKLEERVKPEMATVVLQNISEFGEVDEQIVSAENLPYILKGYRENSDGNLQIAQVDDGQYTYIIETPEGFEEGTEFELADGEHYIIEEYQENYEETSQDSQYETVYVQQQMETSEQDTEVETSEVYTISEEIEGQYSEDDIVPEDDDQQMAIVEETEVSSEEHVRKEKPLPTIIQQEKLHVQIKQVIKPKDRTQNKPKIKTEIILDQHKHDRVAEQVYVGNVLLADDTALLEEVGGATELIGSANEELGGDDDKKPPPEKDMQLMYECSICGKGFRTASGVTRHISVSHWKTQDENFPQDKVQDVLAFSLCPCCGEPSDSAHTIMLPEKWESRILDQKVEEQCDVFHILLKISTIEDFRKWLRDYENLTGTSYVIQNTDIKNGKKLIFKQRLICHRFTKCKKTYSPSVKNKTRNTNCPSRLTVKIHNIPEKFRGAKEKLDLFKTMPCEIKLVSSHNHATGTVDSLRFRKVSDSVREQLLGLYANGHTAATALEMIKCDIQMRNDDYVTALADRNQCPTYKYCYDLFTKTFKVQFGPVDFNSNVKTFLKNKLQSYNEKVADRCAKIDFIGEGSSDYVIGICSPIMKRVHKYIENASKIVFMDSSGTVDKDGSRIFVLLTDSECGALPLGIIVTTSESVEAIKCGFNILIELVGETIFGGHKEGPKVFMTDDSAAEQKAVGDVWPGAKRLLCIFHVLQAVSRWLSKSQNGVRKEDQPQMYTDFRKILYSANWNEMTNNYQQAVENGKTYLGYVNYLCNYWWPKRESWVKAYRNSWLINNNLTNNFSEIAIRQLKDKIFSRIKAFNLVQMTDFLLTKFENYNKRKLLDASNNRSRNSFLDRQIKILPAELIERIVQLDNNTVAVPSETKSDLIYLVNMDVLICSCVAGNTGIICKHIDWANMLFCSESYPNKIDNLKIRQKLYLVATGQAPMPFIPKKETANSDSSTFSMVSEEHPSRSSKELVHEQSKKITNCTKNDYSEIKKEYEETKNKINIVFDQYFEKSPLEVLNSMKKMCETMKDKIKTPAAFSSANATYGFSDFKCPECNKLFNLRNSLDRHVSIEHPCGDSYECVDCKKKFASKELLIDHTRVHSLKSVKCPDCGREFTRKYHLDRHIGQTGCMGLPKQVYECRVCNKSFTRKDNLAEHLKAHAGIMNRKKKRFICEFCNKDFNGLALLNVHVRTHTGERPYGCDICEKKFPSSGAMKKHRRMHTGEKPYTCPQCGNKFAAKETLNRHWRTHTGEKPHECKYCGKSFIQAAQLRAHIFHHTGENAYTCPHCNRAFNRKLRLTTHIKFMHEGAEPLTCTYPGCNKTFFRKEDIQRHLMTHSGEKPYSCEICGKSFVVKSSLKIHQMTHKKEAPVSCEVCSRAFIRQDCLMRHMRARHRDVLEDIVSNAEKKRLEKQLFQAVTSAANKAAVKDTVVWNELTLTESIKELLSLLVDEDCLKEFGHPEAPVDRVLESVIRRCGHNPASEADYDYIEKMRENAKLLFTVVIDDQAVKELLNNQTVDEVIMHVLKLAKRETNGALVKRENDEDSVEDDIDDNSSQMTNEEITIEMEDSNEMPQKRKLEDDDMDENEIDDPEPEPENEDDEIVNDDDEDDDLVEKSVEHEAENVESNKESDNCIYFK